ncbi:peptidylprolyl isomerase [Candidatus Woesearchaeota archaeon]|nr:peptidylprolyl isomerase [Candidatus Woesearchaeota archaeon]
MANSGPKAKAGDKVSVWYTGKLQSGEIFDTNVEEMAEGTDIVREKFEPLSFTVGAGQMIKGFDNAVVGMKVGEKKTVELAPDEAYGSYKAEYVQTLPLAEFESTFKPVDDLEEGMVLYYQSQNGRIGSFMIKTIGRDFVTIDFNHELAGKSLIFDIELASIDE